MTWKKAFLPAIAALLVLLAACGAKADHAQTEAGGASGGDSPSIRIGYLPITHAAPLYIEKELTKDKDKGFQLELVKFGSWPDLMDALNTGKIEGASVLIELAMKAKEQGIGLTALALGHKDGNVLVVANDVSKVQDLQGKPFAIPSKFSTHNVLLYQMLKNAGMSYSDVKAVELAPAEMPAALAEGRISGYVVAEPFGAKSVVIGKGKVLYQSGEIWQDSVDCGLVMRSDFISANRDAVQAFVNAYVEAGRKAEAKDEEDKRILKTYMNVDDKVLDQSLQWIKYDDLRLDEKSYDTLRDYLAEMGLSQNPPSFADFVDNSFIDAAKGS
ncbi:ABC transporter substrate-binding protein [Cohnella caldifontis]|uniref:ABC transporter substrate-binding protein n=1 Tax=Cohnella caldifontis TaxID=3027471 RepID=UPI0023ECA08B|nr:ABC transporter substrate-binding protein [Cohnella sp. YIM B05605]